MVQNNQRVPIDGFSTTCHSPQQRQTQDLHAMMDGPGQNRNSKAICNNHEHAAR